MKKILNFFVGLTLGLASLFPSVNVSAVDAPSAPSASHFAVDTAIITSCNTGNGSEDILCILNLVVDIMTACVGILAVLGITIVGVQYLTAGGNEEKVRKSKRRMLEIVIGLAVYAVAFALLKWLGVSAITS